MIRRVRIRGYKSLRDVEVRFPGPLVVAMGPNAAGKSNLFDALGLLSRSCGRATLDEAFLEHRGRIIEAFTFGPGGVSEALAKDSLTCSFEVDVALSHSAIAQTEEDIAHRRAGLETAKPDRSPKVTEQILRYRLQIEYRPQDRVLRVLDEELPALRKDEMPKESRESFISRARKGDRDVIQLRLEGQGSRPLEFEVGLPHTIVSRPHYSPHYPHIEAFKRELAGWRFYYLEPSAMREDNDLKSVSLPGHFGEDLAAFFDTLKARRPQQFQATVRALRLLLPAVESIDVERSDDGFLRLIVREGGIDYPGRVISEGTLRLLGLLAILQPHTPATVVGFEEPENGVHPRRVATVAGLLRNIADAGAFQVIVNTHSAMLAQCMPRECLLVCRKEDGGTTFSPFETLGPLFADQDKEGIEKALRPDGETDLQG